MRIVTLAISAFTDNGRYCTPQCPYFHVSIADTNRSGLAKCTVFGKVLLWDNRVKLRSNGFPRCEECREAEARAKRETK
jgi:hypothetical protein